LNWIDFILLFLILGAGASGYAKGFIRNLRSTGSIVGGFFAARFICATQADQIENLFGIREKTWRFFYPLVTSLFESLPSPEAIGPDHIIEALRVPAVLRTFLTDPAQRVLAGLTGQTNLMLSNLAEFLTNRLADIAAFGLVFLGTWLLIRILLHFAFTLIIPAGRNSLIKSTDKFVGMATGAAVEALILICVVGILFPLVSVPEWANRSSGFFASGVRDSFFIPWMTLGFQKILLHWIMPLF
jgi:uncharacterized membrane protein required for colicin V production